ncbi:ABC transporter permease [Ferrimonas senticii]|uniref:ABC transporter permease n=1 Tax=Ferrimonas senticii TaxID=394566 RepID=UPI00040F7D0E|nr:ABC transporter permease [Ferrimonas senticii]
MQRRNLYGLLQQRLGQLLLVVWGVGTLTFVLMRNLPGDMAHRIAAGRYGQDNVDSAAAELVRHQLNLDMPWWQAYGHWLTDLLQLDLGQSFVSGLPVIGMVQHQLGHSLLLALVGIVMAALIALPLGILAARHGGYVDHLLLWGSSGLRALPVFVIGLLLILLFSVHLQLLPVAGFGTWQHLLLPSLTLAISLAAVSSRVVRSSTRQVLAAPFYRFARSKGLSPAQTFRLHGWRNLALPVVAFMGIQLISVIEGIVMIESLFSWPGIGHGLAHAIFARDIPMIQGSALMMGILFVVLNTVVDLLCYWLDPRGGQP